jgi:hypothetical protein
VFKRDEPKKWICRNCGYVHEGPEAPDVCPACSHPRAYYGLLVEAYQLAPFARFACHSRAIRVPCARETH